MTDLSVFSESARLVYAQLRDRARNAYGIWHNPEAAWWPIGPSYRNAIESLFDAGIIDIGQPFCDGWILARIRHDKIL